MFHEFVPIIILRLNRYRLLIATTLKNKCIIIRHAILEHFGKGGVLNKSIVTVQDL